MTTVGFIGLGHMGSGMAANLAKSEMGVWAYDLNQDAIEQARRAGCFGCDNISEAVTGADVIVTMLPAGKHVLDVYDNSLLEYASEGCLLIDCSTIDVTTAKEVAQMAADRGLLAADAPVSGGIAAANAGTLTFMVGGSDEAFAKAQPILGAMGKAVIHAGASGAGQAAKICNNMILGAEMIATCEAFALAEKLGLAADKFFDIASVSSGQSWSLTSYCPVPGVGPETPADRDYQGGFATALMLKDLVLSQEAAASVGADTPMGARARELYQAFADAGNGALDFSAIIKTLR